MIEMHTEEPFDDDDGSYPAYPGLAGRLWQLVWSPAALGIASLALGLAALTISQASEEIGEVSFFGSGANSSSELSQIRVAAGVRLAMALVGVLLAVVAGVRVLTAAPMTGDDADDEPLDEYDGPLWVRALAGGGLLVGLLAALLSLASLIYALQAKIPPNSFG